MTTLIARYPLQPLSMSSAQSGSRRHSARLQQKDDAPPTSNTQYNSTEREQLEKAVAKAHTGFTGSKKRKIQYDEEDDGFMFARVKKKKPRSSNGAPEEQQISKASPVRKEKPTHVTQHRSQPGDEAAANRDEPETLATKRRKRMSFSTPATKGKEPVRRSKRLSNDASMEESSPQPRARQKQANTAKVWKHGPETANPSSKSGGDLREEEGSAGLALIAKSPKEDHSATKISLPFADTPVISRNKAMREGTHKGERRSSLGLRGRRASSLIDSGSSNALPHSEVQIPEFYKHVESELMEPRRMRQLLTWCATRAVHLKPQGTNFEDASAKSAARVIEEELLKDLANKSELSDWFNREDAPAQAVTLPERPNPKNVQNATKIAELEEQIKRLRVEKEGLEALLRPPSLLDMGQPEHQTLKTDRSLLSESDEALLTSIEQSRGTFEDISSRVQSISRNLRPAIDSFADGIHRLAQYRNAADGVAGQILTLCAEKLADREREGRRKALSVEEDRSPGRDLSSVLRGLSKADR